MAEDINAVSYCVGMSLGSSLAQQNLKGLSVDAIAQALKDTFEDQPLKYTPEEANQLIQSYLRSESEKAFKVNKEAGEAYLAENKQKAGVQVTPSGLQFEVLVEGDGEKPGATSSVTVHYHGTLIDGTVFDSSVERGQPATFGVNQVIPGWTEALQLMSKGSKFRLFIPQELAYGASPHPGGPIEPYMALIFEVELLDVTQ